MEKAATVEKWKQWTQEYSGESVAVLMEMDHQGKGGCLTGGMEHRRKHRCVVEEGKIRDNFSFENDVSVGHLGAFA